MRPWATSVWVTSTDSTCGLCFSTKAWHVEKASCHELNHANFFFWHSHVVQKKSEPEVLRAKLLSERIWESLRRRAEPRLPGHLDPFIFVVYMKLLRKSWKAPPVETYISELSESRGIEEEGLWLSVSPISWKVSLDSLMRLSLSRHESSESESRGIQSRGLLPEEVASTPV